MPAAADIRALIVDDQQTIRSLVRAGLKEIGVQSIEDAVDGEDGLRNLFSRKINLVISDFNMPNLDGLSFLRAVRATPQLKNTAFVMLTGRADADLIKRAQQFGVNNYLVKPFTVATLRQKLEEVFGPLT